MTNQERYNYWLYCPEALEDMGRAFKWYDITKNLILSTLRLILLPFRLYKEKQQERLYKELGEKLLGSKGSLIEKYRNRGGIEGYASDLIEECEKRGDYKTIKKIDEQLNNIKIF